MIAIDVAIIIFFCFNTIFEIIANIVRGRNTNFKCSHTLSFTGDINPISKLLFVKSKAKCCNVPNNIAIKKDITKYFFMLFKFVYYDLFCVATTLSPQ